MRNKILIKVFSCVLVIVSVFTIGTIMTNATGNVTDQIRTYTYNGDGGALTTPLRGKWDDTSSYIKNYSSSNTALAAGVGRANSTGSGYLPDRYYRSSYYSFDMSKLKSVAIGQERYLPNYVYEDGYSYANVHFYPSHAGYIKIAWSPDSV